MTPIHEVIAALRYSGYVPRVGLGWSGISIIVPGISEKLLDAYREKYPAYEFRTLPAPDEQCWYPPSGQLNPSWKRVDGGM